MQPFRDSFTRSISTASRLLARDGRTIDEPFFRDTVLVHARETVDIGLLPSTKGAG